MPFLTVLFQSSIFRGFLLVACLSGIATWAYMAVHSRGVAACERDHQIADAAASEAQHQQYLAAVERGEQISAKLAETQRRLNAKEAEYLTYANAITGVCDPSVRLLVEYASGAKTGVPTTPGAPAATSPAESTADLAYQARVTRLLGANVAINYARLDKCLAEFNSLLDWHDSEKAVK